MSVWDDYIIDYGGRLHLDEFPKEAVHSYNHFIYRASHSIDFIVNQIPNLKSIDFAIIDNYAFNAFALGSKGHYFIGVSRGAIASLLLIYDRILADPSHFNDIGNINDENHDLPLISHITKNFVTLVDKLPEFRRPNCDVRNKYAKHLVGLSFDFILAHELSHILRGHVDYANHNYNLNLDELSVHEENSSKYALFRKTIELDADQGATETLLSSELDKYTGVLQKPDGYSKLYNSIEKILFQFSFASSIIFKIFGDQRLDTSLFHTENYPRPPLRNYSSLIQIPILPEFLNILKKEKIILGDGYIPKSSIKGLLELERVMEKITGKKSKIDTISEIWNQEGISQIRILYKNYNQNLLTELEKNGLAHNQDA